MLYIAKNAGAQPFPWLKWGSRFKQQRNHKKRETRIPGFSIPEFIFGKTSISDPDKDIHPQREGHRCGRMRRRGDKFNQAGTAAWP
jgi:hypothetical protein